MAPAISNAFEHNLHDVLDNFSWSGKCGSNMEPGIQVRATDAGRPLCRGQGANILAHFVVHTAYAELNFLDLCKCGCGLVAEQHIAAAFEPQADTRERLQVAIMQGSGDGFPFGFGFQFAHPPLEVEALLAEEPMRYPAIARYTALIR
jgi:hypothetical protein